MSTNDKPLGTETLCSGCKWGKIMIAKNMVDEDDDGDLFLVDQFMVRSMCHNPLFVGRNGLAQNMGTVTICEEFTARKEYQTPTVKTKKRTQKRIKKA